MYHVAAFFLNQPTVTAPAALGVVQDDYLTPAQNNLAYTLDKPLKLYGGYAQGVANITRANIFTPIFRPMGPQEIVPVAIGAAVPSLIPPQVAVENAPTIPRVDPIQLQTLNPGAAEDHHGVIFLGDGVRNVSGEEIRTVRCTSAITATNDVWGSGALTFETALPAGRYRVVGMDVVGGSLVAARLIFTNQQMRPGCICRTALTVLPTNTFRRGNLGPWGEFESYSPPTLQLFGTAASVTQTIALDIQQIRSGV